MAMNIFEKFPDIHFNNLVLRKLRKEDSESIFEYFSNKEVMKYYDLEAFNYLDQAVGIIDRWNSNYENKQGIRWGISKQENDRIIGTCGFHNWSKENHKAEVGYELNQNYWNNGIMTKVIEKIVEVGFEEMNLNRIEALYDPLNIASAKVLQKTGFIREGVLRDYYFEKGKFCDAEICSILKRDLL